GRILDADTDKPIPTKIYVIDNQTQKKLDFVYNPDPETGDYLIILPPARNYDMIIECEGFLPYTLNINIPNQDYFYEIYQMVYLKTIKQFDVTVGQEVIVKNAFYDTKVEAVADMRKTSEAALIKSDSIDAYELMADLIAAGDQDGIDYLLELMSMTSTIDQINFDATENENLEAANRTYYYDESDESKFEKKVIDGQTILSLPTFYVTETAKEQKEAKIEAAKYDKNLLNTVVKVYYNAGASNLDTKYNVSLDKIYNILKENTQLGVEISGYASNDGDEETNRKLSNERAIAVLEYLNHKGIVRRRIKARGYGATKNEGGSKEEGRRVELKIVDLNSYK
ncbi:MAG: OmpA family protein, partial [Cyclobacteriaceae bacterium]|nr:OmpA family protein [Cyclobacteriaceae bacterium]